jgi:hypothetical protein
LIAQLFQRRGDETAVVVEYAVEDSPNVFDHDGSRPDLIDQTNHRWEQVPLVAVPQLLTGN